MQRCRAAGLTQNGGQVLLDEVGLAFFNHQHRALTFAKAQYFAFNHRVGDVHHIQRHFGLAIDIGQAQTLQRAQLGVVATALDNDAYIVSAFSKELIELVVLDITHGSRPALFDLFLLMHKARWRQHDTADIALWILQRLLQRKFGALVLSCDKMAMHVAGANAQLQHDWRIAGFRQLKAFFDRIHNTGQIRTWVQHPDLRLHRKSVAALLHDGGAFAIVLAHDDQGPTLDTARSQVGQCIRRDVGAHRRLEGDSAAQGIVHRSR